MGTKFTGFFYDVEIIEIYCGNNILCSNNTIVSDGSQEMLGVLQEESYEDIYPLTEEEIICSTYTIYTNHVNNDD